MPESLSALVLPRWIAAARPVVRFLAHPWQRTIGCLSRELRFALASVVALGLITLSASVTL